MLEPADPHDLNTCTQLKIDSPLQARYFPGEEGGGGTLRYRGGGGGGAYARYQNFKIPLKH